jgi:nucleoside-diphosphate-sugar epimerase
MRVLLTGHTGYLGTVMAKDLADDGHEVHGLDTGLFADRVLGPTPTAVTGRRMDVRDVRPEDLAGFDAVIHLAALSNDPLGALAPDITYEINHRASVRLALAAKQAGVGRFLYASTCSVYGTSGGDRLVDESAPLAPITPYAISKVKVEKDLHALADTTFSPTYLRNATAFGFSPRLRADIVLNNLVGWAVLTGTVKVLSDGTPWRPLAHTKDISAAFRAVLTADPSLVCDEAFNVGSDINNVRVSDIAEVVQATVPGTTLEVTGEAGGDPRSYRVDFSKIRSRLPEFTPAWTIADGARELADAYAAFDLTQQGFDVSFTRLAWLQNLISGGRIDAQTLRWLA